MLSLYDWFSWGYVRQNALFEHVWVDWLFISFERESSPLNCWILWQEEFRQMVASDGQSLIKNVAFESEKLRLFRCATINGGDNMQVFHEYLTS